MLGGGFSEFGSVVGPSTLSALVAVIGRFSLIFIRPSVSSTSAGALAQVEYGSKILVLSGALVVQKIPC